MFVSKKSNLNEWKNWAIGLVGNTMSSIDQATSRWFWNLINGLPRDYFAKAFDQVNYLDKRVWEGMFRANIEEIKEQLELGVSESIVEANLVKLQGLVGKYSLSPVIYENGLEELEDFISNLSNAGNYLKVLKGIRSEFREELKSQPALLKECIEGEANLGRKEGEYYKSLLDDRSLKNVSPERVISESPILDKATVSKRGNNNYKLRNISKLLFSNPGQALTLFLAAQSAFASAANIQMSNSTGLAIGNDTLSFDNNLSNLSEFKGRVNENVSPNSISKSSNFRNSNKVRKEIEVVERDLDGGFTEIRDEFKDLRDTAELVEVLTYVKSQRSKRAANELDSEMETVAEDPWQTIDGLDKRVKELEGEIQKLKNSTSSFVKGYKDQIASLEGQKMILERSFNDMKRQSNQTLTQRDGEISGLKVIVENLEKQVKNLKETIQENERKYLYVECTRDIKARKFKDAEKKLAQINNETETSNIVKNVYSGRIDNFPLLLEFGKSIGDTKLAFWFCAGLSKEMSETTTGNFLETIELAEFLQKKFILPMDIGIGVSEQASILFYNMKNSINEIAKGNLKNIILSYDNISYCQTTLFSNGVYFLDENLFKRLIRETVSDLYGKVNINRMLECLLHDLSVEKSIEVCEIVIYKLGAKHFPNDDTLKLAVYIKNITESHYSQATSEVREKLDKLKERLPELARVLAFSSHACIKNVENNEYLYAYDNCVYDKLRCQRVFTCTSSGEIQNGKWQFELAHSMYYYIRNINNGKYLYPIQRPSGTAPYELKRREVFARDGKAEWEVLFTSDGVRLRSVNLGEYYLYSSSRSYYNSHEVFIGGKLSEFGNIRITSWKFEDCGNSRRRRDVKEVQDVRNSTEESLQENINPSAQISDITLERVKITDKNISFTGR